MAIRFGLYPGGVAGDDAGRLVGGPPDDPSAIRRALDAIDRGAQRRLLVRCYTGFNDQRGSDATDIGSPRDAQQYAEHGRHLDLVAQYQSRAADVDGYARFVRNLVRRFGPSTATLQIAEEPNVTGNPVLDGDYPEVHRAIGAGVAAAREEARACGFDHLRVGINTTPLFGPGTRFYENLLTAAPALHDDLDYVGLDLFPDVFRPVPAESLRAAVRGLIAWHRDLLCAAGVGHLPLHVTEHGWPTGPARSPERQAEVLRDVIGAIVDAHEEFNVTTYELFSLRDADSSGESLFHQFGIMTGDYAAKPAFAVFAALVAAHSRS